MAKFLGDEAFRAMADPTRRKILRLLVKGEMSAGQIGEHFEISGPSVSHHLSVLKAADLVATRREGQQIIYTLNTTVIQDLIALILEMFRQEEDRS
jgi:DNA-binding transcriptional ArsR family regulator